MEGKKVGLLDTDFHGPSIPTLLNLEGKRPGSDGTSILPVEYVEGIKVMSIGFLVPNRDDAVIWRGPMKMNVIKQLLSDVNWGTLDYLVVDFPPGTGDEPLSVAQLIPHSNGAVIVTTPQDLSLNDVRKCINFCRQVNIPVLGVIENMSGLVCPNCHHLIDVFKSGGGEKMAKEMDVPFLGKIPIDPNVVEASDRGMPFVYHYSKSDAGKAFREAIEPLLNLTPSGASAVSAETLKKDSDMKTTRIAIPVVQGRLSPHFGHCDTFTIYDIDPEKKEILSETTEEAPPHEPGLLPRWLGEKGVHVIIAGGMGARAQELFNRAGDIGFHRRTFRHPRSDCQCLYGRHFDPGGITSVTTNDRQEDDRGIIEALLGMAYEKAAEVYSEALVDAGMNPQHYGTLPEPRRICGSHRDLRRHRPDLSSGKKGYHRGIKVFHRRMHVYHRRGGNGNQAVPAQINPGLPFYKRKRDSYATAQDARGSQALCAVGRNDIPEGVEGVHRRQGDTINQEVCDDRNRSDHRG